MNIDYLSPEYKLLPSPKKQKYNDPETQFRKQFRTIAVKRNMIVVPIPDPKGNYNWAVKRAFDFVLITSQNTFCIEAKVEHNQLLPHQKGTSEAIEKLNPMSYWIIRKRITKKRGVLYSIEKYRNGRKEVIMESEYCELIVKYFQEV